jgi:hypothetical protein
VDHPVAQIGTQSDRMVAMRRAPAGAQGVRYYVVHSDEVKEQAARSPAFVEVATSPDTDGQPPRGRTVYEVRTPRWSRGSP